MPGDYGEGAHAVEPQPCPHAGSPPGDGAQQAGFSRSGRPDELDHLLTTLEMLVAHRHAHKASFTSRSTRSSGCEPLISITRVTAANLSCETISTLRRSWSGGVSGLRRAATSTGTFNRTTTSGGTSSASRNDACSLRATKRRSQDEAVRHSA